MYGSMDRQNMYLKEPLSYSMIKLRALEPSDLDDLYKWENNKDVWLHSDTTRPLSKETLQLYVRSVNDIYTDKQVRFIIEVDGNSVGCVDLFDYHPLHQRAAVGIILDPQHIGKGYALAALEELKNYAFQNLGLHQLHCTILDGNTKSIQLFERAGFKLAGHRLDWYRVEKNWKKELFYHCFNH